ncbi:hypothetical protein OUZ56_008857 [Daphnia magna]|uniref:Uncharacterized protein n=1 Tax=Daphnia magna TaxID=35525 RepID=A0ABR0AE96_9CRUS|nr:hypothetical protein OUZ56_008857 [Daphnia magna]
MYNINSHAISASPRLPTLQFQCLQRPPTLSFVIFLALALIFLPFRNWQPQETDNSESTTNNRVEENGFPLAKETRKPFKVVSKPSEKCKPPQNSEGTARTDNTMLPSARLQQHMSCC